MSSYPSTSTATPPGITVSTPGQDQRHSVAVKNGVSMNPTSTSPHSTRATTPPSSVRPGGIISSVQYSPLSTLVNVAASMEPVLPDDTRKVPSPLKEKLHSRLNFDSTPLPLTQQSKAIITPPGAKFSYVDYATNDSKKAVREAAVRSVSPRPSSLTPDQRATRTHRSPSPSRLKKNKPHEGQFTGLPTFEDGPTVVKPKISKATYRYCPPGVDPIVLVQSKDDGHDSDSSGSGSILHSSSNPQKRKGGRRKKRAEPLSVLKADSSRISRDEQGMKPPETPSLAPMTLGDFSLKIQPISPGIDLPYHHHQQHLPQKLPKENILKGFPPHSGMAHPPSLPLPHVGKHDTNKPISMVASPPKPTLTPTVGEMMEMCSAGEATLSSHQQPGFIPTSIPQSHKETKPVTSIPSASFKAEHETPLPHVKYLKSQNHPVTSLTPTAVGVGIPFTQAMFAPHHPLPASIQTHCSIVTPAVIQTSGSDGGKSEPRNTSSSATAIGSVHVNTAHSPKPNKVRKRKVGPEVQMEASKRSPPLSDREESGEPQSKSIPPPPPYLFPNMNKTQVSKQIMESFMPPDETKEKMMLPPGFDYDPNLPMNIQYQLISFENQQKLAQQKRCKEEYQLQMEQQQREEHSGKMKAAKPRGPRKQKSFELPTHSQPGMLPSSHIMSPQHPSITSPPTPPQGKGGGRLPTHPMLAQASVITSQDNNPQIIHSSIKG